MAFAFLQWQSLTACVLVFRHGRFQAAGNPRSASNGTSRAAMEEHEGPKFEEASG